MWMLLLANLYFFWQEFRLSPKQLDAFIWSWAIIPRSLFSVPQEHWYTLITAMFLHGGWLHLLSNLLFLYIFSRPIEDQFGTLKFLIFYFTVGIVANSAQAYALRSTQLPLLGASGAIAGVLGAYFFYFPHSRITALLPVGIFITIRDIPAFFFLGLWFLLQIMNSTFQLSAPSLTGGVAWWAHACGFMAGILLAPVFGPKKGVQR